MMPPRLNKCCLAMPQCSAAGTTQTFPSIPMAAYQSQAHRHWGRAAWTCRPLALAGHQHHQHQVPGGSGGNLQPGGSHGTTQREDGHRRALLPLPTHTASHHHTAAHATSPHACHTIIHELGIRATVELGHHLSRSLLATSAASIALAHSLAACTCTWGMGGGGCEARRGGCIAKQPMGLPPAGTSALHGMSRVQGVLASGM